jgi:hypothetical protein
MQNACHPDTTDRSMGYFGISGTHSHDQSRSPGFMVVGRNKRVKPIQRFGKGSAFSESPPTIFTRSTRNDLKCIHLVVGWKCWHSYSLVCSYKVFSSSLPPADKAQSILLS